jgi:dTDP-4-amino-4,6-dideoxygalactose transaminase
MTDAHSPDFIPVARPWMGEPEAVAAGRVILSGWVTQGPEVRAFEEDSLPPSVPLTRAVASCTVALHLALQVVRGRAGRQVITVDHSSSPPPTRSAIAARCRCSSTSGWTTSTWTRP